MIKEFMGKIKRTDLNKINPNIVKWLKNNDPVLLNIYAPKINHEKVVIEKVQLILNEIEIRGFRNAIKEDKRIRNYINETKDYGYKKVDVIVAKILSFPTERDILIKKKAEKLIIEIKKNGTRPNLSNRIAATTWNWIKRNQKNEYKKLMQTIPSAQEGRVLNKLNKLLLFCQKNKRKPNESRTEVKLSSWYHNLLAPSKKTTRKNKFYIDIIQEIESHVIPQHRIITKELAVEECRKYSSLSELHKNDSSLYKQVSIKPWWKELKFVIFPEARSKGHTLNECILDAKKYKYIKNWRAKSCTIYGYAKYKKWLPQCQAHMTKVRLWTKVECLKEARKYSSVKDWEKYSRSSMSAARRYGWYLECKDHMTNLLRKYVKNTDTGKVFETMSAAARSVKVDSGSMTYACKLGKLAGGYHWAYCDENGKVIKNKGKKK